MKTTTDKDALQKAIEYLGAVEVAPNYYAFKADEGTGLDDFYTVGSFPEVDDFGGVLFRLPHAMPAWWTPEKRFAWRIKDEGRSNVGPGDLAERFPTDITAAREAEFIGGARIQRITADLNTGEEVPA